MVLNIDGIQKLKGHLFHNREVEKVSIAERFGRDSASYVFHFGSCPIHTPKPSQRLKQWGDPFEVYLGRYPQNGIYELFVMGLHGITCQHLYWSEIQNFSEFHSAMGIVIGRAKKYWEEE